MTGLTMRNHGAAMNGNSPAKGAGHGAPPGIVRAIPVLPIMRVLAAIAGLAVGGVSAETPVPPSRRPRVTVQGIPPYSPDGPPAPAAPIVRPPAGAPVATPGHPTPPPAGPAMRPGLLAWDAEAKEAAVALGTAEVPFAFLVTNVSPEPVTILSVSTSCGCTAAKLATLPWTLAPGAKGKIDVVMNLAGKRDVIIKTVTLNTDHGFKTLTVRTDIQEPPAGAMNQADRLKNLQIASANRQAVLHGACASCHATPALDKTGGALYQAACAICHEATHRAASVPDLKQLQKATDAGYWRSWITAGAQGKLMPAFAIEHGGILDAAQIDSLVKYLTETIPSGKPSAPSPAPPPSAR